MKDLMQTFLIITLIFFSSIFMITLIVDYEKEIENYVEVLENKAYKIDSLIMEVDSLAKELEHYDFEYQIKYQIKQYKDTFLNLLDAIIQVESSNNDSAYCSREDAVGCLQIRQTMVDDVNRILKRQGEDKRFTYNDRWDRIKSIKMFKIYIDYYNLYSAEDIARSWNGGPRGGNKENTVYYWNKVKSELEEIII